MGAPEEGSGRDYCITHDRLKPWTTLDRRVEFSGGPIREIVKETVQLPDGRIVPDYTARMGDYALVCRHDRGQGPGPPSMQHGVGRVCLTFPGGYVAPGKTLLLPRSRTSRGDWLSRGNPIPLGSFVTNANQGCNTAHMFRIDGCQWECEPNSGDLEGKWSSRSLRQENY